MSENRLAREAESRQTEQRITTWRPPETLPSPVPQPGWVYRWIRTSIMGQADPTNASAKLREGWEPCKAEDHPELMLQADPNSRYKGNVEIGGLLLCKAPEGLMKQRDAFYRNQSDAQVTSVDNSFLRQSDSRMPLFSEKKSSVSFGKGK
jgi:hypothetical protein